MQNQHIWISGIKISQLAERNDNLRNLKWFGEIPPCYSVHIFQNKDNTGGIIACSDAFGGGVAWARFEGENKLLGKNLEIDADSKEYIIRKYPLLWEAINNL